MRAFLKAAGLAAGLALSASLAMADTVKVSVSAEPYPPFASKNASGQWEGFEVDLVKMLCAKMKADCQIVETAWDGIIPALTSKKIDVIFASMSITDERKQTIAFSIPYYNTPAAVVAPKSSKIGITADSMKGKIIGVQTATIHQNYAEKYFSKIATIKVYNTQDEANADLAAGRIDASIADSAALEPFLATPEGKDLELKGFFPKTDPIWGDGVGAGMRKEDTKLKAAFDDAIRAVYKDGSYTTLMKKYFKYDVGTPPKS
jgi:polar amino acid transport system substrate-binding protein